MEQRKSPITGIADLLIGDREQHVGVAGRIERAVASEVAPPKLPLHIFDADRQTVREEVLVVTTNRLCPPERQGVRVAPLGRSCHHDDARRKPSSLAT